MRVAMDAARFGKGAAVEAAVAGRFLFGVLSGTALVVCGLVLAAALFPLTPTEATVTAAPATEAVEPVVPEIAPTESAAAPLDPTIPDAPAAPAVVAEPAEIDPAALPDPLTVAEPDPVAAPDPVFETPPAAEPAPEVNGDGSAETALVVTAADPAVVAIAPAQPDPAAEGAATPDVAADPAAGVATEAEAPAATLVEGDAPTVVPDAPVTETDETPVLAGDVVVPLPDTSPDTSPDTQPDIPPVTPTESAAEPAPEPELATLPDSGDVLLDPAADPTAEPTPAPSAEPVAPETEVIAEPAHELNRTDDGIIIGRLPRIGDPPVEDAVAAAAPVAATPLQEFAEVFLNLDKKPVFAIVLIDPGTADLDRAGLAALPFPVSFALDPLDPATPDRAAIYRAGGKEVVMLATGIADGAQASDIEVAFQSMAQGLPEAVAVMDVDGSLFQNNRPVASLIVPVVAAQGRGLLTWDVGLNAADQVARREDVPAGVVFRDLAASGEDGAAIQRILGRAIFKAGQDGRVVVAATATPGLVATLLEWSVEGKAASVALAPVSAVLTVE
ncbi:MAG: hypothetical protein B7Z10_00075 [Rhodobacterales bacterium 32-66-7]|nr:MAG: hypothetical protein B7Z10_00075 [Rhodobacterales bacterium 32-66-7]